MCKVIRKGIRRGVQRYRCTHCKMNFQNVHRKQRMQTSLWNQYVWHRQTIPQLAERYHKSTRWIRQQLDHAPLRTFHLYPQPIIGIADVTFWGRGYGVIVFRSWDLKQNLYWTEVATERIADYAEGRHILADLGYSFDAIVLDGRRGIRDLFQDIPVQVCHFHQIAILKRYLTSKPKLDAGRELWDIGKTLSKTEEVVFMEALKQWYTRWRTFLMERTYAEDGTHWQYTHRRIRAAYRSLTTNLPYLFTYQKYPHLNIPNTTNSLDGSFGHLNDVLGLHRGLKRHRRWRLIQEILAK